MKRTENIHKSKRLAPSTSGSFSRAIDEELRIIADRRESEAGTTARAA